MSQLRILQIHNRYRVRGGEEVVFGAERKLLVEHGHEVGQLLVDNEQIDGLLDQVVVALRCAYSRPSRDAVAAEVRRFAPDVIHVHNFFPLLSPSIYDAAGAAGVPVVQTLHNYRTVCASALLLRDGRVCEKCVEGNPFWGTIHGCYRDSRLASLAVANMIHYHRRRRTWQSKVDCFVALSSFARRLFIRAGFPDDKVVVKPNFVAPDPAIGTGEGGYALFVGRLSHEKGIHVLLDAWRVLGASIPLVIVGERRADDPPLPDDVPGVRWVGPASRDRALEMMGDAAFLVCPSVCYEGTPLALVEAMSKGTAAIASDLGSMSELVVDGRTGRLFKPGDSSALIEAVRWMLAHPEKRLRMGAEGRRAFEQRYTGERNYDMLMNIYRRVCGGRR